MTKDELLKKLDFYLKDEHDAAFEYVKFIQELHNFFGNNCLDNNDPMHKCLDDMTRLPHDEMQHWNILDRLKCQLGRF
jgi:hypothetical protein